MTERNAKSGTKKRRRLWLSLLVALLLGGSWWAWSAAAYAVNLRAYSVPTGSMSPAIAAGDRVCAEFHSPLPPKRGEIWVFEMPPARMTAIKRVIGLPGETVEVARGKVLIDGEPLSEPYLLTPPTYTMPPVKLSASEYFMMGDSRNASADSHVWGPLQADRLIGRAVYRYWPMRRFGGL